MSKKPKPANKMTATLDGRPIAVREIARALPDFDVLESSKRTYKRGLYPKTDITIKALATPDDICHFCELMRKRKRFQFAVTVNEPGLMTTATVDVTASHWDLDPTEPGLIVVEYVVFPVREVEITTRKVRRRKR